MHLLTLIIMVYLLALQVVHSYSGSDADQCDGDRRLYNAFGHSEPLGHTAAAGGALLLAASAVAGGDRATAGGRIHTF